MAQIKNPVGRLSNLFGADVTCEKSLRAVFYSTAQIQKSPENVTGIPVPSEVYEKYLDLYRYSQDLVQALYAVLDDGEHMLVMKEAQELGYSLPDLNNFRDDLDLYRDFLKEMQPFVGVPVSGRPGYVKMPRHIAASFHHLMSYNCMIVGRIMSGCFETEYMAHFANLNRLGAQYAGPTALQQTVDLLKAMKNTVKEIERQIGAGRQRHNWPEMVVKV